jgi:exonuclease SbcC
MKLKALSIHGIGRFHEEARLPVEELGDARVVAVVGLNGAGKSTLIECVPASLSGDMPSRGSLASMANAGDSFVEATLETDQAYTLRWEVNANLRKPKTTAYLFDADMRPLSDGKQKTFAAEVAKRFPSTAIYLASGFAAQKRTGQFLESSRVERRGIFAEMLGLGRLQQLSKAAGERAAAIESAAAADRGRIDALEDDASLLVDARARLAGAEVQRDDARVARERAEETAAKVRREIESWHATHDTLSAALVDARADLEAARRRYSDAVAEHERADDALTKLSVRQAQLAGQIAGRGAAEAAIAEGEAAAERLAEIESAVKALRGEQDAHRARVDAWRSELHELTRRVTEESHKHTQAQDRASAAWTSAMREVEAAETSAAALRAVPCGGDGDFASCALIAGAAKARQSLDSLREACDAADAAVSEAQSEPATLTKARAALDAHGEAPAAPDTSALADLEAAADEQRARQTRAAEARARLDAIADAERRSGELGIEAEELRATLARLRRDLPALLSSRDTAEAACSTAQEALGLCEQRKPQAYDETELRRLRSAEADAIAKVATATAAVERAETAATKIKEVRAAIDGKLADLDDWKHLAKALGKDGVQALEVDAAGPEVSDLINELLHSCYGSRFSVAFETTALKADGKGTKEVFDLRCIDTEMGFEGSASDLSGGERVLVAEALGLALAIYNARRSSIPILDLWRDECAGALDYEKAPLYVTMLRKALDLGGFHRVYFVAHQRELWDLADERLLVEGGGVRIAGAPEVEERINREENIA